jgi:hypothetical protein
LRLAAEVFVLDFLICLRDSKEVRGKLSFPHAIYEF